MYDIYWKRPTMKNCLICNVEISENKKYCSRQCYNKNLKEMLISRNKSNIGKTWEEIMDKNTAELRRTKQSEKLKNNNPSSNPEVAKKISDKIKQVRKENPLTGEKNPFYGKKHSQEFKEKSSLTKKGKRSYNEEQFEKQNEKTPQIEEIEESVQEREKRLDTKYREAVKNKYKRCMISNKPDFLSQVAHIYPYKLCEPEEKYDQENGFFLSAELHILFDTNDSKLRIDPETKSIILSDRKSTRLNSSHVSESRMPSSA